MEKINFQDYPNTTTPINTTNLNQLQTNVENGINVSKSIDANGWTVLTYNNHKEYLITDTYSLTMQGNTWGNVSVKRLPDGMSTLGNNFLTASIRPNDGAICCTMGIRPTDNAVSIQAYNAYNEQIDVVFYYSLRIIELPSE